METLFLLAAFVLGSFRTGVVVARAKGGDLRKVGSGNIGTANVGRALGRAWAAFVLLVDAGKGALPVLLARQLFPSPWLAAAAGFIAASGQVFSVFLKGCGGKGVATSLGAGLALSPWSALGPAAVWIVLLRASGWSVVRAENGDLSFTSPAGEPVPRIQRLGEVSPRAGIHRLTRQTRRSFAVGASRPRLPPSMLGVVGIRRQLVGSRSCVEGPRRRLEGRRRGLEGSRRRLEASRSGLEGRCRNNVVSRICAAGGDRALRGLTAGQTCRMT